MRVIGLDRLWMTKVNLQKSSKRLEADNHHHPRYHQTCLSPDDKRDFDSLWIGRVRATICWLPVSLDLLSLDGEGADNHEVSPHAIRPSSHDSRFVCMDNHKVSPHVIGPLSHDSKIMCTDNHKISLHATGPSSHDSKGETFSRSWPEDVDISGKGAEDHIGLCVSTGSLASS